MPTNCVCGASVEAILYRKFLPNDPFVCKAEEFLLAGVSGTLPSFAGVFSRDDCERMLEKLVARWSLRARSIVIATPFVGFVYGTKTYARYMHTWQRLLYLVDPEVVTLITRSRSISEFKRISKQFGVDQGELQRYGLLHPVLERYVKCNTFHAKFYAGVGEATTEVFTGSYNFQDGKYLDNVALARYTTDEFRRSFFVPMKTPWPLRSKEPGRSLYIALDEQPNSRVISIPPTLLF
jgi:hypothetical protein